MPQQLRYFFIVGILLLMAACAPIVPKPVARQATTLEIPTLQWVLQFDSPKLNRLVLDALDQAPSINAAIARVQAARARTVISGADRYPNISAGLSASRSKRNSSGISFSGNTFTLNSDIAWEVDLWQRLKHRHRAATADAQASAADLAAAKLSLASEVARGWFTVIEAGLQQQLAEQRVSSFRNTFDIINQRYKAGVSEALDVYLARENLASGQAVFAVKQQRLDAAQRNLETLAGYYPSASITAATTLPASIRPVPPDLTSQLLLRRPDLLAAEQRLVSSIERASDRRRNLLPGFRLTASGGTTSQEFRKLMSLDNLIWNIAASLIQPVFQGGRLKAERLLADANQREAIANYSAAVLAAFREVETALAAEPLIAAQAGYQNTAADEANNAAKLALSRYNAGLTEIITLLDTQRRAFNARSSLLETQLNRLRNRIDLHLALGGDFQPPILAKTSQNP